MKNKTAVLTANSRRLRHMADVAGVFAKQKLLRTIAVFILLLFAACDIVDEVLSFTFLNGTYTFSERPQAVQNGVPLNMYLAKVEVTDEWMTFHFENAAEGGSGYSGGPYDSNWTTGNSSNTTLYNLFDTTEYVKLANKTNNGSSSIKTLVFPRLEARRFKLENTSQSMVLVFSEIDLSKANYSRN